MAEVYTKDQSDAQAQIIGAAIKNRTSPGAVAAAIAAQLDANLITDAERDAIAQISPSPFKGDFADLADIPTVGAQAGDYAVLTKVGEDDTTAIFDVDAGAWIDTGAAVTGETAASVKTKYESNPNTNAFTDAHLAKLDGLQFAADNTSYIAAFTAGLDG